MKNILINEDLLLADESYSNSIFVHSNKPFAIGILKEKIDDNNLIIYINDEDGNAICYERVTNFSNALEKSKRIYTKFHRNSINSLEEKKNNTK